MPKFADYHRTIIGYHGTRMSTAKDIVLGEQLFSPSVNEDDWLGNGIYFWEYGPQRAWRWAKDRYQDEEIAVLGAMIRLQNCFDLLDPDNVLALEKHYAQMIADCKATGITPPKNVRSSKYLDCRVFEYVYAASEAAGEAVDSCRAVFVPSGGRKQRPWTASGIFHGAHIQICVRNVSCIQGVWLLKPEEDDQ